MVAIALTILFASLVGSPHCAGMCGGFVVFALADPRAQHVHPFLLPAAYNLGRLTTYVLLGAVCGGLGAMLDAGGDLLGVQRLAAFVTGTMMICVGAAGLLRCVGFHLPLPALPPRWERLVQRGHLLAMRQAPAARAALTGLLTTLLPCGWLYAFAITAAGAGSPLGGAAVMAVFWLGTLPVMLALGFGIRRMSAALAKRLPLLTALAILGVGLYSLAGRASLFSADFSHIRPVAADLAAGGRADVNATVGTLPCCAKHDE